MFPHIFQYFSKSPSSEPSLETESPVVFFEAPSSDLVDLDMGIDDSEEDNTALRTEERPISKSYCQSLLHINGFPASFTSSLLLTISSTVAVETRQARYFPFSLFTRSDAWMSDLDLSSPTEDCANETIIREANETSIEEVVEEVEDQEEADAQWEKSWDQGKGLLQGRYRKGNLAGSGTVAR